MCTSSYYLFMVLRSCVLIIYLWYKGHVYLFLLIIYGIKVMCTYSYYLFMM